VTFVFNGSKVNVIAKRVHEQKTEPSTFSRMGDYKLLKEAHIFGMLERQWGLDAIHHYGTCFYTEDSTSVTDFATGLTAFYEKGESLSKGPARRSIVQSLGPQDGAAKGGVRSGQQHWNDKWVEMLRRLHFSSMGSIEITDVKWSQFIWLRGQIHMSDMDDVFVYPTDAHGRRNQTPVDNCKALDKKLGAGNSGFGYDVRECVARVLGMELESADLTVLCKTNDTALCQTTEYRHVRRNSSAYATHHVRANSTVSSSRRRRAGKPVGRTRCHGEPVPGGAKVLTSGGIHAACAFDGKQNTSTSFWTHSPPAAGATVTVQLPGGEAGTGPFSNASVHTGSLDDGDDRCKACVLEAQRGGEGGWVKLADVGEDGAAFANLNGTHVQALRLRVLETQDSWLRVGGLVLERSSVSPVKAV